MGTYFRHPFELEGADLFQVDFEEGTKVRDLIVSQSPDLLVHTAAVRDPDYCERNKKKASNINAEATKWIAESCAEIGCPMIYISSDLVFSDSDTPWKPGDVPEPMSHYGATKYLGEQATLDASQDNTVVRISLLVGQTGLPHHKSWVKWLIEKATKRIPITLFSDQFRNGTYLEDAVATIAMIGQQKKCGTFHVACCDTSSRAQMGYAIAKAFGLDSSLFKEGPIEKDESLIAKRPKKLPLEVSGTESELGIKLPTFKEAIGKMARSFSREWS